MAKDGTKTGGRSRGTPNKTTKIVKDVFATVFSEIQKDKKANLTNWAKENPTEFYKLAAKLIPIQVSGEDGKGVFEGITINVIKTEQSRNGSKN